jgi:hypothetical protein
VLGAAARLGAWLALAALGAPLARAQDSWLIREVEVGTRDVFAADEAAEHGLYRFFNSLHVPTREEVVRREVWFESGDRITEQERAELERNLRATGLFGAIDVRLEETGTPGEVDLVVDTRDRFSLIGSAGGSVVGEVTGYYVLVGETNLFGTGNSISLSASGNDEDESEFGIDYSDWQLFDTWHRLDVAAGATEEGPFVRAAVTRPFKHLQDPWSYGVAAGDEENDVDYFAGGESVAEVPRARTALRVFGERAHGPVELRRSLGLELAYDDSRFGAASGPAAGQIAVPGDLTQASFGPYGRIQWEHAYRELQHLDALDYVQDATLGAELELFAGALHRDEAGAGDKVETLVRTSLRTAAEALPETYLTLSAAGQARWYAGDTMGWTAAAALHAFQLSLPRQTLALSLAYDEVFEDENLPLQLNLGEDSGLRGYPAREFAGTERYRLNLEDRIDVGASWRSFDLGMVAFFDAGWIAAGQPDLDDALRSVGLGLRIGSSEVLGSGVLRLDFSFPLDDFAGEDYDPLVSLAYGQVFGFYGNASTLPTE